MMAADDVRLNMFKTMSTFDFKVTPQKKHKLLETLL